MKRIANINRKNSLKTNAVKLMQSELVISKKLKIGLKESKDIKNLKGN